MKCPVCHGGGEVIYDHSENPPSICRECGGKGTAKNVAGLPDPVDCAGCNDEGIVDGVPCSQCERGRWYGDRGDFG